MALIEQRLMMTEIGGLIKRDQTVIKPAVLETPNGLRKNQFGSLIKRARHRSCLQLHSVESARVARSVRAKANVGRGPF